MVKAYWWKTDAGWVGFVSAKTWSGLFDMIDVQTDPYSCEFIPANGFVASWKNHDEDSESEFSDIQYDVYKDLVPDLDDPRWKKIDWDSKSGTPYHNWGNNKVEIA